MDNKTCGFFLLLLLFAVLVSSCEEKIKERTYTCYFGDSNLASLDLSSTTVGREIKKLTGVTLDMQYLAGSDEFEYTEIMIASGHYPDIIYGHNSTRRFVSENVLIPLNDLIDRYGPNIKKYYGPLLSQYKQADGSIYYIGPNVRSSNNRLVSSSGFWLPIRLLKEFGYPEIKTFTDYFELIRKYCQKYPATDGQPTIGFTAVTDSWRFFSLTLAPSALMGYPNDGTVFVDQETLEAKMIMTREFAKTYYSMLNRLWNEGLVDPGLFSQTYDQYLSKLASGRVIGFFDHYWQMSPAQSVLYRRQKDDFIYLPFPVVFEGVEHETYNFVETAVFSQGVGISVSCQDPVGVMKFWNRMLEEDIQKLIYWGVENVDYEMEGEKMVKRPGHFQMTMDSNYMNSSGIGKFTFGFPQRPYYSHFETGEPLEPDDLPEFLAVHYTPSERNAIAAYGVKSWVELFEKAKRNTYGYGWDIIRPKDHPTNKIEKDYNKIVKEYLQKGITAPEGTFEQVWQEFQEKLAVLDLKSLEAYRTEIFRERDRTWREAEKEQNENKK